MENHERDNHLNEDIAVVIYNRIDSSQCFRKTFRHVIHPVHIAADGMKKSPQHTGANVTDGQTVLFFVPKSGDSQCRKGKEVIAAGLERCQEITSAALDKLENAIGKCSQQTDFDTEPVPDIADKKHAEQGNGTSHRHFVFDVGSNKCEGKCNARESQLLSANFF